MFSERFVIQTPEAVSCELVGETVILDMPSGKYYALDPVGTRVWQLLRDRQTAQQLCARLTAEYEVDPDRCLQDLEVLLKDLAAKGLIRFENV